MDVTRAINMAMQFWIVTGGAATGKSAFSRLLIESVADGSFSHFSSDEAVRQLWSEPGVVKAVSETIGPRFDIAIQPDGRVDLRKAREIFFSEPEMRLKLEAVMHPRVYAMLEEAKTQAQNASKAKVFLAEVPLYYESRPSLPADTVIVVAASRIVQRLRLLGHRKLDAVTCEGLLNAQLPVELKAQQADLVVWNDGSPAALEAQAMTLLRDRWQSSTIS